MVRSPRPLNLQRRYISPAQLLNSPPSCPRQLPCPAILAIHRARKIDDHTPGLSFLLRELKLAHSPPFNSDFSFILHSPCAPAHLLARLRLVADPVQQPQLGRSVEFESIATLDGSVDCQQSSPCRTSSLGTYRRDDVDELLTQAPISCMDTMGLLLTSGI
jgi:hypothetical protein